MQALGGYIEEVIFVGVKCVGRVLSIKYIVGSESAAALGGINTRMPLKGKRGTLL